MVTDVMLLTRSVGKNRVQNSSEKKSGKNGSSEENSSEEESSEEKSSEEKSSEEESNEEESNEEESSEENEQEPQFSVFKTLTYCEDAKVILAVGINFTVTNSIKSCTDKLKK